MGVYTKVYGGRVVKRVVERYWPSSKDARDYLAIFGVVDNKGLRGTHFEDGDYKFSLSHPIEQIRVEDELPDNADSVVMKPRDSQPSFVRGTIKKMAQDDEERLVSDFLSKKSDEPTKKKSKGDKNDDYPAPAPRKSSASTGDVVCLKDICKEIKMEPRAARVILRKKIKDRDPNSRWEWSKKEADAIKKILESNRE
jgi:hypothetical protein